MPDIPNPAQQRGNYGGLYGLRAKYEKKFGEQPPADWDAAMLRQKISE